jgi:hypothetical protein
MNSPEIVTMPRKESMTRRGDAGGQYMQSARFVLGA